MSIDILLGLVSAAFAALMVLYMRQRRRRMRLLQLMAQTSHELKVPLNSIMGFAALINSESYGRLGDPKYLECASMITESGRYMQRLIADYVQWAQLQDGYYKPVSSEFAVGPLLDEAMKMVRAMPVAGGKKFEVLSDNNLMLRSDRAGVQKILLNLLSNAVKFTGENGRIEVAAVQTQRGVEIAVSDDGRGMDKSQLKRLGRPFVKFTGDGNAQGSGLGISIVHQLARALKIKLKIQSQPDQGTKAVLLFKGK